jgi:uncharacterized delta-60 repeat protein
MRLPSFRHWNRAHKVRRTRDRAWTPSVEAVEARCLLAAGGLDRSFSGDGKAVFDFPDTGTFGGDWATAVAIQNDGRILVAGTVDADPDLFSVDEGAFGVVRLTNTGSLDHSFSGDGKLTVSFPGTTSARLEGMAVQADGKILLAGTAYRTGGQGIFAVARLNPSGSLDRSFDHDGLMTFSFSTAAAYEELSAIALQTDGKIVVVGDADGKMAVARLTPGGGFDRTFGQQGKMTIAFPGASTVYASAVAIQQDGKIIVGGEAENSQNSDFALARLKSNGKLDTSFGTNGRTTAAFEVGGNATARSASVSALALQKDGSIVAVGQALVGVESSEGPPDEDMAVARFRTNGRLDSSFDGDGKTTIPFGPVAHRFNSARGLAIQNDGKIVVVGAAAQSEDDRGDVAVARLRTDGTLDKSFDGDGRATVNFGLGGANFDDADGVALQHDGRIVVVGSANTGPGDTQFAVLRFLGDTSKRPKMAARPF